MVTTALIIAAGAGSRLQQITGSLPKPLLPVAGVPLIKRIILTAHKAGIERFVIVTGHAVDLYDTRTIRASVGSVFAIPVVRLPSHNELAVWLEMLRSLFGVQVVGTSAKATRDILDADLSRPTVLAIGNETIGLSRSYRGLCDEMYRIPMYGSATSLNVASAASILLYEADRQRRTWKDSCPVV